MNASESVEVLALAETGIVLVQQIEALEQSLVSNHLTVISDSGIIKRYPNVRLTKLNSKQGKTLQAIFTVPTHSDLKWREIEALLVHLGAEIKEGKGSRVRVFLKGEVGIFHEPHPTNKEVCRCTVESVRDLLKNSGINFP